MIEAEVLSALDLILLSSVVDNRREIGRKEGQEDMHLGYARASLLVKLEWAEIPAENVEIS